MLVEAMSTIMQDWEGTKKQVASHLLLIVCHRPLIYIL
jgi:hypothetical protein